MNFLEPIPSLPLQLPRTAIHRTKATMSSAAQTDLLFIYLHQIVERNITVNNTSNEMQHQKRDILPEQGFPSKNLPFMHGVVWFFMM
jgi:hypothetical protein